MALKTIVPLWLPPQKKYLYKSIDTNGLYIKIKNYTIDHIFVYSPDIHIHVQK